MRCNKVPFARGSQRTFDFLSDRAAARLAGNTRTITSLLTVTPCRFQIREVDQVNDFKRTGDLLVQCLSPCPAKRSLQMERRHAALSATHLTMMFSRGASPDRFEAASERASRRSVFSPYEFPAVIVDASRRNGLTRPIQHTAWRLGRRRSRLLRHHRLRSEEKPEGCVVLCANHWRQTGASCAGARDRNHPGRAGRLSQRRTRCERFLRPRHDVATSGSVAALRIAASALC